MQHVSDGHGPSHINLNVGFMRSGREVYKNADRKGGRKFFAIRSDPLLITYTNCANELIKGCPEQH